MNFWSAVIVAVFVLFALSDIFLITRFSKFALIKKISGEKRALRAFFGFLILALLTIVLCFTLDYINTVLILIHLTIVWLICEAAGLIIRKIRKKSFKRYYVGAAAILITAVYFALGAFFAYNVWEKDYSLESDKLPGPLKVAMIADSHTGTTFDGEGFARHLEEIQKTSPDLLVIAGDFVDDDTTKEDMERCCEALGSFETKYGIYFSFGNHDNGYFDYRNFTGNELVESLEKNGVVVLRDKAVLVDDLFYVVGRKDKSESLYGSQRAEIGELVSGLDASKYIIVIDHQPADYAAEAAAGVDLVLSGHTHGGQMLVVEQVMELTGQNDMIYGIKDIDDTSFIVTSGISDWAIKFKTCCRSEYVIININGDR